jgi:hypothetical protein
VVPDLASANDPSAVELGVKFRVDVAGSVAGVRFYKGSTNTGTHVGKLWRLDGTLLASATFAGETASGWQQVTFPSPVPVAAGTTYVASYHTNAGHYAYSGGYFASAGVDSPPLHALRDGAAGGDGVYQYGGGGFPTQTYQSANYWVDVVFQPGSAASAARVAGAAPLAKSARPAAAVRQAGGVRADRRPWRLSRLRYALSVLRGVDNESESYAVIRPGTRGVLNGGKVISPYGQ